MEVNTLEKTNWSISNATSLGGTFFKFFSWFLVHQGNLRKSFAKSSTRIFDEFLEKVLRNVKTNSNFFFRDLRNFQKTFVDFFRNHDFCISVKYLKNVGFYRVCEGVHECKHGSQAVWKWTHPKKINWSILNAASLGGTFFKFFSWFLVHRVGQVKWHLF